MSDLLDAKVGDDVLFSRGSYHADSVRTIITRTTATRLMITVGGRVLAFHRKNGWFIGGGSYNVAHIKMWHDDLQPCVDEGEKYRLCVWLRGADFKKVPLATLREIAAMVKAAQ